MPTQSSACVLCAMGNDDYHGMQKVKNFCPYHEQEHRTEADILLPGLHPQINQIDLIPFHLIFHTILFVKIHWLVNIITYNLIVPISMVFDYRSPLNRSSGIKLCNPAIYQYPIRRKF